MLFGAFPRTRYRSVQLLAGAHAASHLSVAQFGLDATRIGPLDPYAAVEGLDPLVDERFDGCIASANSAKQPSTICLSVIVTLPSCIVRKLASAPGSARDPAGRFIITGAAAKTRGRDSQHGRPARTAPWWSLTLDGTKHLPVYPALYEVLGDLPHFPVDVL